MTRRWVWLVPSLGAALGAGIACSSSSHPPDNGTVPPHDSGVIDTGGAEASQQGDSGSSDAGEASADGDDAGDATDELSPNVPECSETATWANVAGVPSIPAASFARFGAISANELTVAWTDSTGAIFAADRPSVTSDFGAPVAIPAGGQALANGRVALNPTGTELIATLAGGGSFTTFLRASPGQAWQTGGKSPFLAIDATVAESGGAFSEPVLSADGLSLFYLLVIGKHLPVFYESAWDPGTKTWMLGNPLSGSDFHIAGTSQLRRPTGAASDRLTLFFFDEITGNERAAWRDFPTSPFTFFVDLPGLPEAAPSTSCLTLYFQETVAEASTSNLATAQ